MTGTYTDRWATPDTCPACVGNTEAPVGITTTDGQPGYVAAYKCHDCGHTWTTSWRD